MKDVTKFLLFITYSTIIFFLPNNIIILFFVLANLSIMIISKIKPKKVIHKSMLVSPFIILTFVINCILDNITNATWIAIKLFIVCNITIIYSETTNITRNSRNSKNIMYSFKNFQSKC